MELDITKEVRLKNPEKGEENLVYKVSNYNRVTQRCYIELICDLPIKPQELVSINDIENVPGTEIKKIVYRGVHLAYTHYTSEKILDDAYEVTLMLNKDVIAVIMVNEEQLKTL
nr:hypothetical protein [uncultured Draconibacterium sp.]